MAVFEKAVIATLAAEGVLSNDKHDKGGITAWGITGETLDVYRRKTGLLAHVQVATLSRDEAVAIYRALYWRYDMVNSQFIATKMFDLGVNVGLTQAQLFVQRAINFIGGPQIAEDGMWGAATLERLNVIGSMKVTALAWFKALVYFGAVFYVGLVAKNHTQSDFIDGWLTRLCTRPPF